MLFRSGAVELATGDYLAIMADCQLKLGNLLEAQKLLDEARAVPRPPIPEQVELIGALEREFERVVARRISVRR